LERAAASLARARLLSERLFVVVFVFVWWAYVLCTRGRCPPPSIPFLSPSIDASAAAHTSASAAAAAVDARRKEGEEERCAAILPIVLRANKHEQNASFS
jgi:hypothetical protein